jgi:signal transduction histidine kinase
MLHKLLTENRAEIIARSKAKAAARAGLSPAARAFELGIPMFVDHLIGRLQSRVSNEQVARGGALIGREFLKTGLAVDLLVHTYGDVCQSVTEFAIEHALPINPPEYKLLNQCLDDAIAEAVAEYARGREGTISAQGTERMGFFGHELRNLLGTAMLAFEVLQTGRVGMSGSTGDMLGRSLRGLRVLIDRALTEVRIAAQVQNPERVPLDEFIDEVSGTSSVELKVRDLRLVVAHSEPGLVVCADRQLLFSAVSNLMQNAAKFTRPHSTVSLTVQTQGERVLIDVADECGGLPPGKADELFRSFEQRGADRTGLGLGLSIVKQAVEMSGGTVKVRNHPGHGCAFIIDLPKWQEPSREADVRPRPAEPALPAQDPAEIDPPLEHALDRAQELVEVALDHVAIGAGGERSRDVAPLHVARDHDAAELGLPALEHPDQLDPAHVRQRDIDQHEIGRTDLRQPQGLLPGAGHGRDAEPRDRQQAPAERRQHGLVVLDHHNAR